MRENFGGNSTLIRSLDGDQRPPNAPLLKSTYTVVGKADFRPNLEKRMKKLNSEQEVVTRHIEKMGPGDRVIISGSAGSGKTFAITRSVANRKALFLAPTHPARTVLEAELGSSGQRGMTIHSFIGWRGYRDEGLVRRDRYRPAREASFRSKSKGQLSTCPFSEAEIIIVDECSMVGAFLFAAIEEYADEFGLPVVYSGDPYQLPPVNDREVIWDQGFETLTLKESMRFSKDSEIFRMSDALRRMIASDPDSELPVLEGGADLVVTPGTQWMQDLRADYANSASCLAVSSLNDMLQRLRGKVRGLSHDRLAVGDLVMSKKTDERFLNGEQFTIRQITSDTRELHNVPSCVVGTGTLEISGQSITFAETDTTAFIVEKGRKEAISRQVRDLYDEDRLEHADAVSILDWLDEVNEFELSALATVHKSQGRTVDTLYVDTATVLKRASWLSPRDHKRLLYTALT